MWSIRQGPCRRAGSLGTARPARRCADEAGGDRGGLDVHAGARLGPDARARADRHRELVLHDIDPERLEVVGGMAQRMLERQGYRARSDADRRARRRARGRRMRPDPDPRRRPGGPPARREDPGGLRLHRPGDDRRRRARQGDAHGARWCSRSRERARGLAADDAWIIDFTNPVGIVTRALLDAGHRAIGLCNVAINFQRHIAAHLGVAPERVLVDQVGLNHLTWIRAVWLDGRDVLADVLRSSATTSPRRSSCRAAARQARGDPVVLPALLLRRARGARGAARRAAPGAGRGRDRAAAARALSRPLADQKPALLEQRGGAFYSEAAVQLVASLMADTGEMLVVDVRNHGTLAGLADDDVVEVPARIGSAGAAPLPQRPLAPELLGLVQHVAAYERLAAARRAPATRSRTAGADDESAGPRVRAGRRAARAVARG